jgi:sulfite exporter TauE/SafE
MELASVHTPAAAFVAGLVTSLHCVGMCGPLACMLAPARGSRTDPALVYSAYHGARLVAYGTLGAVAGALGAIPASALDRPVVHLIPWLMVAYFVFVALKLGRHLPRLALLGRVQLVLRTWVRGRPAVQVAAAMGAATPLLPCGPLYFLVALAAFAGSAVGGAELLLAFGLGTLPLLWLAQGQLGRMASRLGPAGFDRARSALALLSAAVMIWRLRADLGLEGPGWASFLCH